MSSTNIRYASRSMGLGTGWRKGLTRLVDETTTSEPSPFANMTTEGTSSWLLWLDEGIVDHASGGHEATAEFKNQCAAQASNQQRCDVLMQAVAAPDTGTVTNLLYYHVGHTDSKTNGQTGARGTDVSSQSAAGGAFKYIDLDYRESKRTEEYGNKFKFRARVRDVHDAQIGRWAWDVFLVRLP